MASSWQRTGPTTEPDLKELSDLIIAEADHLGALANYLLQGSGKQHLAVVNIHEALERVAALLAAHEARRD